MTQTPQIDGPIAFLGAGRMAQALAAGFIEAGLASTDQIVAYDPHAAAGEAFQAAVGSGSRLAETPAKAALGAKYVFLAVKPAHAAEALASIRDGWDATQALVSVAAGVTIDTLESGLPQGAAVVRVMPNTPCLVGKGASCYALGTHAAPEQGEEVGRLLSAVGFASEVPEKLLDAVTGLSGSGPAFVYTMIEALADGGVRSGLPRDLAAQLAASTVAGAAQMVLSTEQHPAALRDAVASPGGTTIAGLAEIERHGVRTALIEAVTAATKRSAELGSK